MIYNIDVPRFGRFFSVPCAAAERFMSTADGNYYKVLLCVLCSDGFVVDSEELAARAGVDTAVAEDALLFWTGHGIISARPDGQAVMPAFTAPAPAPMPMAAVPVSAPVMQPVMQPVQSVQPAAQTANTAIVPAQGTYVPPEARPPKHKKPKATIRYTQTEIADIINSSPEISELFEQVQRVLGRPLKSHESTGFINLFDYYGFSPPSILILTQFVHDLGKDSMGYIDAVASDWFSKGITEYADIEHEISRLTEQYSVNEKIKRILGIEGPTTKLQSEYFEQWCSWGFDVDTIGLAGEICRNSKSKNELPYINGILRRWRDDGLMTVRAVFEHDKQYAAKKAELQAKYGKDGNSESSTINNDKWYEINEAFNPWDLLGDDYDDEDETKK